MSGIFDVITQMLADQMQKPAAEAAREERIATLMTPTVMPSANSDAQRATRRRSQAEQAKRRGRDSTIYTVLDSLGASDN